MRNRIYIEIDVAGGVRTRWLYEYIHSKRNPIKLGYLKVASQATFFFYSLTPSKL